MGKTALGKVSFVWTLSALSFASPLADATPIAKPVAGIVVQTPSSGPFQWLSGGNRRGVVSTFAAPAGRGDTGRGLASYVAARSPGPASQRAQSPRAARTPTDVSFHGAGFAGSGPINCVTFARSISDIELQGNASGWWANAADRYQRGSRPELGEILSFRATANTPLGHVAVVRQVVSTRLIEIDHANWGKGRGRVDLAVPVEDISPNTDWTLVRVQATATGEFGSNYHTNGFIYNRASGRALFAVNR